MPPEEPCVEEAKAWKEAYEEAERLWEEFTDARSTWLAKAGGTLLLCSPASIATGVGAGKCAMGVGVSWEGFWDAKEKQAASNAAAEKANELLEEYNDCYHNPKIPWFEP